MGLCIDHGFPSFLLCVSTLGRLAGRFVSTREQRAAAARKAFRKLSNGASVCFVVILASRSTDRNSGHATTR
jgi:hypothetical protein